MKFIMSVSFSISLWPWAVGSVEASGDLASGILITSRTLYRSRVVDREEGLGRVNDWQVKYCR